MSTTQKDDNEKEESFVDPALHRIQTHFVFLVHGLWGNDLEMSYIEKAIHKAASKSGNSNNKNNNNIVVRKTLWNNGKTTDGIAAGGKRLANEITQIIRTYQSQHQSSSNEGNENSTVVTLSFIGNSLGGLYARYALSLLSFPFDIPNNSNSNSNNNSNSSNNNRKVTVLPAIFCTTATPHLGISSNTFFPLPRFVERMIAPIMGQTGMDLFQLDDHENVLYRIGTEDLFLNPLRQFTKRLAYINAFRTDFQVPTETAGFLNRKSTYPHYHYEKDDDDDDTIKSFVAAIFHTPTSNLQTIDLEKAKSDAFSSDALIMSNNLDALGWTKIFVDVRTKLVLPTISIPFVVEKTREKLDQFMKKRHKEKKEEEDQTIELESQEIARLVVPSDVISIPLGHVVMVANSKNVQYEKLTVGGREVMDWLAQNFVNDLWAMEEKEGERHGLLDGG